LYLCSSYKLWFWIFFYSFSLLSSGVICATALQSWNSSSQSGCTYHSRAKKWKRIEEDPEPQFVTGAQVQSGTSSCLPILRCYEVSSINFCPSSQVSSTGRSQRHFALGSLRQHCSAELWRRKCQVWRQLVLGALYVRYNNDNESKNNK
jgi:hypothetical protein